MIELKKEEPPVDKRRCTSCGKAVDKKSEGKLIHWPSASCVGAKTVKIITGEEMEPFSFWTYTCRWCRAIETKRKSRQKGLYREKVEHILLLRYWTSFVGCMYFDHLQFYEPVKNSDRGFFAYSEKFLSRLFWRRRTSQSTLTKAG